MAKRSGSVLPGGGFNKWLSLSLSRSVHRLARVCADEIAGKRFRKGLIDADSVEDAAAMIQAQIYREWGVAIVKGRAECLLALLELRYRTRRRGPRSPAGSRGTS